MKRITLFSMLFLVVSILVFTSSAYAQITVYNNFGPGYGGWDYNYSMGWTVAGENVPTQYGVEQAMGFQSTASGVVTDIWVAFFYAPFSTYPDEVTILLAGNPQGLPPDSANVMETWTLTEFETWSQWSPPHHLQGNGHSELEEAASYWLWAIGGETTWCGWCLNINPSLTCPHTLRREGENWLPISNETASAFRVDISQMSPLSITLIPAAPPIQIPSIGGRFEFNIAVSNTGISPAEVDIWTMATLPNGNEYGPIIFVEDIILMPGQIIDRHRTQNVPANAPPGEYTYDAYIGLYPDTVWDEDHFDFEKLATGNGVEFACDWTNSGEPFPGESMTEIHPSSFILHPCFPNPFNPSTVISFEMRDAGFVNLTVYDVQGREVAKLMNGQMPAGSHQVVFDGSNLPSGIYFAKLRAGDYSQTQKIMLMK